MQIEISGYDNNHLVITTYEVANQPIAEAVVDGNDWFKINTAIDTAPPYAVLNGNNQFIGMITLFDDPCRAMLCTFPNGNSTEGKLYIYPVKKVSEQLE